MPLLQPTSNSHLRRKTTEFSPHSALSRPILGVSAGRAVPRLLVCPGPSSASHRRWHQAGWPGKATCFPSQKRMKNPHIPHRTFQFLQNQHFPSIHPMGKFLASWEHCACAKSLCRYSELLLWARRLQYFIFSCSASLQSIWEMPFLCTLHYCSNSMCESSSGATKTRWRPQSSRATSQCSWLPGFPSHHLCSFWQSHHPVHWDIP